MARLGLHLPSKCGGTAGPEEGRWSWGFRCCPCGETLTTGTDGREKGLLLSPHSREGAELPASISPTSAIGPRSASGAAEPVMPAGVFVHPGPKPGLGFNEQLATPNWAAAPGLCRELRVLGRRAGGRAAGRWERKSGGTGGRRSGRPPGVLRRAPENGAAAGAGALQWHRGDAPGPERYRRAAAAASASLGARCRRSSAALPPASSPTPTS